MSLISARQLTKRYGQQHALNGFDFTVEAGRIVGLIGANGSGKTTALKSLMGMCQPDAGTLSVLGLDPQRERRTLMTRASYVADAGILPRWMRVQDLLQFVESVQPAFDPTTAATQLARTDIPLQAKVRTLSKGMVVQLHLAMVMACRVELMVLDEPTLGLDILYRRAFYDSVLNDYFTDQRAIVITTHEVAEIEHILTDVVFIHRGQSVLTTSMEAIEERFTKVTAPANAQQQLTNLNPMSQRQTLQGTTAIFDNVDRTTLEPLGELSTPSLADLFVAVVGDMQ